MLAQVRIQDHIVLRVGEYIRFAIGRNGAQLNSQRIASLSIMLHSVIVASAAIKELASTQDGAVC